MDITRSTTTTEEVGKKGGSLNKHLKKPIPPILQELEQHSFTVFMLA